MLNMGLIELLEREASQIIFFPFGIVISTLGALGSVIAALPVTLIVSCVVKAAKILFLI